MDGSMITPLVMPRAESKVLALYLVGLCLKIAQYNRRSITASFKVTWAYMVLHLKNKVSDIKKSDG
jgi:hypothetical protein